MFRIPYDWFVLYRRFSNIQTPSVHDAFILQFTDFRYSGDCLELVFRDWLFRCEGSSTVAIFMASRSLALREGARLQKICVTPFDVGVVGVSVKEDTTSSKFMQHSFSMSINVQNILYYRAVFSARRRTLSNPANRI